MYTRFDEYVSECTRDRRMREFEHQAEVDELERTLHADANRRGIPILNLLRRLGRLFSRGHRAPEIKGTASLPAE